MPRLQGKCALVTGAGAGIGRSIAALFAREGARVAVVDRDGSRAERTCREIEEDGGNALALAADVSRRDAVEHVAQRVREEFGALNILVNNAGIAVRRSFERLSEAQWDLVLDTNLKGVMLCTQHAL